MDSKRVKDGINSVITYQGKEEPAIKCVKVIDGLDTCTVAFVPRVLMTLPKVQEHLNKFVQVVEIFEDSPDSYKQAKARSNYGVATVKYLDENVGRNE